MPTFTKKIMKPIAARENYQFYATEILPDYQARVDVTQRIHNAVPDPTPNEVGMKTINPSTDKGKYFVEFASSSSVHGLNHLVAPNRHPIEKFLAVLFIFGALISLIILSCTFWDRHQNNAVVTVINNDRNSFSIAKPAIYFCPVDNIEYDKLSSAFKRRDIKQTPEAVNFFKFLSNVTYETMKNVPDFDEVPPNEWLEILHEIRKEIPSFLLKEYSKETTDDMLIAVTEKGICGLLRSAFGVFTTLEYWLYKNISVPHYAVRHYNYGDDQGNIETISLSFLTNIAMVDPYEIFEYQKTTRLMRPRVMERLKQTMSQIQTEDRVKQLNVRQRKCKFSHDGGLKSWPVYTWSMCVIECRLNVIQKYCKCRPHFVSPMVNVPICNAKQLRCIGNITEKLFIVNEDPPPECGCYQNCDTDFYSILEDVTSELGTAPTNLSILNFYIEIPLIVYSRTLLFGFTDFLTAVGGTAGLFLGASVLSFVEMFYYASLRVCIYVKNRTKNN